MEGGSITLSGLHPMEGTTRRGAAEREVPGAMCFREAVFQDLEQRNIEIARGRARRVCFQLGSRASPCTIHGIQEGRVAASEERRFLVNCKKRVASKKISADGNPRHLAIQRAHVRSFLSGCHARGGSRPLPRPILGHFVTSELEARYLNARKRVEGTDLHFQR